MPFCTIHDVLISEPVHPSCSAILLENGINVVTKASLSKEELIKEIKKYDALIVRSATKVTKEIIDAADNLKVIGRAGTGVDNIDCDAATLRGILVLNAPGGNAISAAELTCGMIMSLSRNIPQACSSLKDGKWDKKSFMGYELMGKTLGIVGLGRIGREVALRMQSFGMKTIGYDPIIPAEVSKEFGVESLELEQMWPLCDYITVHTPLIPQTKNLINEEVLMSKCKKGVKLVNCARGGIIDEDALLKALQDGHCAGAGLDVFIEEPCKNIALLQHPKVICTPHLGASTHDAQMKVAQEIAVQFVDLGKGKHLGGIVNCPTLVESSNVNNQHWVSLTITVGKLMGSLFEKGSRISGGLTVYGKLLKDRSRMLSISTLVGLLEGQSITGSNLINAPVLAKEAGIEVMPLFSEDLPEVSAQFFSSVMLTASSPNSKSAHSIIATLQDESTLLCAIDGCSFQPAVPLVRKQIFCRGKSDCNLAVQVITQLASLGRISSAFMSTSFNETMWCVIQVDADVPDVPEVPSDLINVIDFWVQVDF